MFSAQILGLLEKYGQAPLAELVDDFGIEETSTGLEVLEEAGLIRVSEDSQVRLVSN
jgi:hypothetical protein